MSESQITSFLNKIAGFFFQFLALIFIYMIIVEFSLFYFMSHEIIFFWVSMLVFGIAILFTFGMVKDFQHFQDMFDQNISNSKYSAEINTPLEIELEDSPLKACLYYRNGYSFKQITHKLRLGDEAQTAKRLLVKGLDILLKNYDQHNIKEVKQQNESITIKK